MKLLLKLYIICMIISAVFSGCDFQNLGSSAPEIKNYLPSAPVNLQAVDVTSDSAKLVWSKSIDPDGSVTDYNVYVGTEPGGNYSLLGNTPETVYILNGLTPDTSYYFTVKAVDNNSAESEPGSEIHVKTNSVIYENLPPSAPQNLQAEMISYNSAELSWSESEDTDGTVTGYNIYMSTTSGSGYSFLAFTALTNYNALSLEADTSYFFAVRAVDDSSAESEAGSELSVHTGPAPVPPQAKFYPADSAIDIAIDTIITITFDRSVRMLNDSEISDLNASGIVTFREDGGSGPEVSFTASINAEKTVITVIPDSPLGYSRVYYAAIEPSVEDSEDIPALPAHITFTTVTEPDTTPPAASFSPADSADGVPADTDIIISFTEPVRLPDNSEITNDTAAGLIIFKEDNDTGEEVVFSASINSDKTAITVTPESTLEFNHYYYIALSTDYEDYNDNPGIASAAVFKTLYLVINELLYDSPGSDTSAKDNFIELYGTPGLDLTGWKIICYNSPSGPYITVNLNGYSMPSDGFFVACASASVANYDMLSPSIELQNGPDSVRLLDPSGQAIDTVGYPGSSSGGPYYFFETNPAPAAEDGKSLSRNADHLDTNDNSADFIVLTTPAPGN